MSMLAHLGANSDKVESGIVAFRMKPEEGQTDVPVHILTLGDDAASILGVGELVKLQLFNRLGSKQ